MRMTTERPGVQTSKLGSETDRELLRRCRNGDSSAFSELYVRHCDAAQHYAMSITRSPHAAADAASEAFIRFFALVKEGRGPEIEMRPYLLRMIRNLCYDEIRRSARLQASSIDTTPIQVHLRRQGLASLEELAEKDEDCAAALRAFHSLPQRWRLVLWNVDVLGNPPRALAGVLGTSGHNVSALLYRAREGLRSAFLSELAGQARPGCQVFASRLGAFALARMGPQERRRVTAHLVWCSACASKLEFVRQEGRTMKLIRFDDSVAVSSTATQ